MHRGDTLVLQNTMDEVMELGGPELELSLSCSEDKIIYKKKKHLRVGFKSSQNLGNILSADGRHCLSIDIHIGLLGSSNPI